MLSENQCLLFTIASLTTGICVLGLLVSEYKASQVGKWAFKPLAAAGFIVSAFAVGAHEHGFGQWVLLALFLSMIGDILLIPARVGGAFAAGLGAFLLGHVAFAIAFIVRGIDGLYTTIAIGLFSLVGVAIYRWLKPNVPPNLRGPVMAYVAVITVMVALSVGTTVYAASTLIPVAAALFWLSDISVARGRFMDAGFSNRLWGIPFYFGAQVMFAYAALI